jgi:hypothetical protein
MWVLNWSVHHPCVAVRPPRTRQDRTGVTVHRSSLRRVIRQCFSGRRSLAYLGPAETWLPRNPVACPLRARSLQSEPGSPRPSVLYRHGTAQIGFAPTWQCTFSSRASRSGRILAEETTKGGAPTWSLYNTTPILPSTTPRPSRFRGVSFL